MLRIAKTYQPIFHFRYYQIETNCLLDARRLFKINDLYVKPIILYSGGLDSFLVALYHKLASIAYPDKYKPAKLLFVNYGHLANDYELQLAKKASELLGFELLAINLSTYQTISDVKTLVNQYREKNASESEAESASHYISFRNTILASYALGIAEQDSTNDVNTVFYGANLSESMTYGDNTTAYENIMSQLSLLGGSKQLIFSAPFIDYTKTQMVFLFTFLQEIGRAIREYSNNWNTCNTLAYITGYLTNSFPAERNIYDLLIKQMRKGIITICDEHGEQIIDALKWLADLPDIDKLLNEYSLSCYYPSIDEQTNQIRECMKCGSCLLKHQALKRGVTYARKLFKQLLDARA